ncbi:hypothetical protein MWU57_15465 [Isoptericola sp. S6320L]|uniref:hypothetical protein n=1 Tax=Isoptericola sp. S6320L TaxID=2926411 RepID=UPI001FF530FF|nr:hypothetical protein [Isoptericola sp. S6320L]MCK0118431.1 hypothetical protein [Isoptericola sp. S6320L]
MSEEIHTAAIRRITRILATMRAPGSPVRAMHSADRAEAPAPPPALDITHTDGEALSRHVAQGRIERLGRSLYIESCDATAGGDHEQYEQSIMREVRRVLAHGGGSAWFSHSTAALLHGAWTYRVPRLVHVTHAVNPHVDSDEASIVRRHHTSLPQRDRDRVSGVPVTTKERTLVDCVRTLPTAAALVVCDSLFRCGADPRQVDLLMSTSKGKRGIVQARRILELCDPRAGSPGESVARLAAVDAGLPRPECQIEAPTRSGTYYVDLGWEDLKVAVEFDGDVKYSGGEYGDPEAARRAELARQRALEQEGWIVIRVRWEDLADLDELGARVRAAYWAALRRRRAA